MEVESGETPTPPRQPDAGGDPLSPEEVRRATFPQALRGYDRQAVHDLLNRVADWMEGNAGSVSSAAPGMRAELAKVGEKTAGILTAAEEAARNLRDEAAEYAERLRADAEDESRKARLNASQRMDEMIAEAEEKSRKIIDQAVARRRQLNLAISSLIDRRDEIAADTTRLAEELLAAVEELVAGPPEEGLEPESADEWASDAVPEPPHDEVVEEESGELDVEEETQLHPGPDSEESEVVTDDNPEVRRPSALLVDPDEDED
jgi:DivIVA domain-containing protein